MAHFPFYVRVPGIGLPHQLVLKSNGIQLLGGRQVFRKPIG
jgi:hypothetical protein